LKDLTFRRLVGLDILYRLEEVSSIDTIE